MANSLTKATASPCVLKYTYIADTAANVLKSLTQLLADCAEGPLKNLLRQVGNGQNAGVSGLTWTTLTASALLSIYMKGYGG